MSSSITSSVECPVCTKSFPRTSINDHVNECLNNVELDEDIAEGETSFEVPSSPTENDAKSKDIFVGNFKDEKISLRVNAEAAKDPNHEQRNEWSFLRSQKSNVSQAKNQTRAVFRNLDQTSVQSSVSPNLRKHAHNPHEKGSRVTESGNLLKRPRLQTDTKDCESINVQPKPIHENERTHPVTSSFQTSSHEKGSLTSQNNCAIKIPLAEKLRPVSLSEFFGQESIVGNNTMLRRLMESEKFCSMILWGPPGCGKTTLAKIIAQCCRRTSSWRFVSLSATTSGISDIKEAVQSAKNEKSFKRKTVLFIDEIHRFNKLQQDAFLPHVEDGTIVLVGATTENPSFHINNALLSRCQVFVLEKLSLDNIRKILLRAIDELNVGLFTADHMEVDDIKTRLGNNVEIYVEEGVIEYICQTCDGDARSALNSLQNLLDAKLSTYIGEFNVITQKDARDSLHRAHVQYDRTGEEHYNCASALQKSIRGSDDNGAIYWLARMLEGGEDPLFIARRLVSCASEDIGLADVNALPLAVATFQACHFLGMPECSVNLGHCVTYLARASKSNETYMALRQARASIKEHVGPLPGVPLHIRNAPTKLMKDLGYNKGYLYNHNFEGPVDQQYLPTELQGTSFFKRADKASLQ